MPQQGKLVPMSSTTQVQHQLQYETLEETIQPAARMLFPVDPEEKINVISVSK